MEFKRHNSESGQGMFEYLAIVVVIACVIIAFLMLLGTQVSTVFSQIASALD